MKTPEVGSELSPEQQYWHGWTVIGIVGWCVSVLPIAVLLYLILQKL